MNNKIPTGTLALTLLAVVSYIMLTEITLVFGPVVMPFAIYLLLKIKKQSTVNYWILFFSFLIPAMLFLSPLASASFIILYCFQPACLHAGAESISGDDTLLHDFCTRTQYDGSSRYHADAWIFKTFIRLVFII